MRADRVRVPRKAQGGVRAKIAAYGTYLPAHRVAVGRGLRVAAGFDEDSTTMGVEAARTLLPHGAAVGGLYFATTSPAYADKTNATAIHAALGLALETMAADFAGAARSGVAAVRMAAATGGLAVLADVRTGLSGSADEHSGGDCAAAFLFGETADPVAEVVAQASLTAEFLDRWRSPGDAAGRQWEDRFGLEHYLPLAERAAKELLSEGGVGAPDHVVITSPNRQVSAKAGRLITGSLSTVAGSPAGHAGAADLGLALASVLDTAEPGQTVLALSLADGVDGFLLRTGTGRRAPRTVAAQLARAHEVPYLTYLSWRGLLTREPPRRPEPDMPAGPPSARAVAWKFGFRGTRCQACGFTHLPPARVCRDCGAVDEMVAEPRAGSAGTVATYTVDRLAFSPSPPLIEAVVDFDGGGRYTLEVADAAPDEVGAGTRVEPVFRRLYTAGGVHNYFWKARPVRADEES
ncbi:hydroxymethylglutaryl-CoA synthase [Amycolatopsis sp. K13G38]|uniref:Hydroxymethylglutaryl-CoA synthase n=2 Tax=Amycolatopsis acididurans TaxID=2724524 RepID=A0ABX1J3J2_9PSEU|nr:hydroxymethylglutaryl-CoA synthase [Amycolatopsis acididurans]